jgi:hypothetical protein
LIYECIMMSYRSSLHFIPVQWFLALGLWNLAKYLVVTILFHYDLIDIDLIFGIWVYNDELQIKFTFRFGPMIFGRVMQSSWKKNSCVSHLVWYPSEFRILYHDKLQISFEIHSGWMIFGQLTAVGLWNLAKYLVVTTFFSLWFEILTFWYVSV